MNLNEKPNTCCCREIILFRIVYNFLQNTLNVGRGKELPQKVFFTFLCNALKLTKSTKRTKTKEAENTQKTVKFRVKCKNGVHLVSSAIYLLTVTPPIEDPYRR